MTDINALIKSLNNDVTFTACHEVSKICSPLYKFGISDFSYVKVYDEGRRIHLVDNQDWSVNYYEKLYEMRYFDNFVLRNGIGLFTKATDSWEIVYFASKLNSHEMMNFYLNNLSLLKRFSHYFKQEAKHLINLGYESNLQTPKEYYRMYEAPAIDEMNPISLRYEASIPHHLLTLRELDSIKWCAIGKTSEETGMILGISKRTVERHMENAKTKLNCTNRYQLMSQVFELGLIELP